MKQNIFLSYKEIVSKWPKLRIRQELPWWPIA